MKRTIGRFSLIVLISFFFASCVATHRSGPRHPDDYRKLGVMKPGLSVAEVQDLLNSPNHLFSGGDDYRRPQSILFLDQKALHPESSRIPSNLVFTFDFGIRKNHPAPPVAALKRLHSEPE